MPTVSPIQTRFNGGEISPSMFGLTDADRYKTSLAKCFNWIATLQGPLDRRPGSIQVAEVKNSNFKTRIIQFQFSTTQSYVLEFGATDDSGSTGYIRFFTNYGEVLSGMAIYEIRTFYGLSHIPDIHFSQSADVLYLTHPLYAQQKLQRYSDTDWRIVQIDFQDGPYQPTNATPATLTPTVPAPGVLTLVSGPVQGITNAVNSGGKIRITSAAHGWVTGQKIFIAGVTGTIEANNGAEDAWTITVVDADTYDLQASTFVNAYAGGGTARPAIWPDYITKHGSYVHQKIRIKQGAVWVWVIAANVLTQYAANVYATYAATTFPGTPVTEWRLGIWYGLQGPANSGQSYPANVTFHEDRLSFSGAPALPQRIDMSNSSDYENFAPTQPDGTVQDNNALSFNLNSNDVNQMRWLVSDEKGMLGGSGGNEWVVRPSVNQEALTPTNISAKKTTTWGSENVIPFQVGKSTMFVQRGGRKLRELIFYFDVDGYRANDMTELAEHITGAGITALSYQKIPYPILWCIRADGALLGMTYERDSQNLRVGWHIHQIAGVSDAAGSPAVVESIATITSPDGTRDDLWMIVRRRINGVTKRYVEYMSKVFDDQDLQEDAHFVDCGAVYDVPKTITGITQANPGVVTSNAHGFANGDGVEIKGVLGMTEVNYKRYTIAGVTANTFQLLEDGVPLNTTGYTVYVSGGTVRKLVSTISGLGYLEGQTVDIWADGAELAPQVVTGGAITLPLPSATVHVGLGYTSDAQMLRLEAGSADGTSVGKNRRTTRSTFMLHRTCELKFGMSAASLDTAIFRTDNVAPNHATPLFTGIHQQTIEADYDFDNQIYMRVDKPGPAKILAVALQMQTQDRR